MSKSITSHPFLCFSLTPSVLLDSWKIHTEPGTGAGEGVPSTYWPRGNCLGGSSALNFLVWDRPSTQELDALEGEWHEIF
jgi:choline dehydrogenase-like flavoprotein